MKFAPGVFLCALLFVSNPHRSNPKIDSEKAPASIFGFRDASAQTAVESRFLAVPDAKLAETHLRELTKAPHMAGTAEDKATADYVASKFREAGLDTEIVEYKVWFNYPQEIRVDLVAPPGVTMHAVGNIQGRQAFSTSSSQDSQHVVLLRRDSFRLDDPGEVALHGIGRPVQGQDRLFRRRAKWVRLPDLFAHRLGLLGHAVERIDDMSTIKDARKSWTLEQLVEPIASQRVARTRTFDAGCLAPYDGRTCASNSARTSR